MAWSLAHVIFSLLHACVPWSCLQPLHISQLLQLTATTLLCARQRERATSLLTPKAVLSPQQGRSSFSSGSLEAASKQLSSWPVRQHGPAGEHSNQGPHLDHTRSGLVWSFRGQKRQSGTPKCLEEQKSGAVDIGRFTQGCFYKGGVATVRLEQFQTRYHVPRED